MTATDVRPRGQRAVPATIRRAKSGRPRRPGLAAFTALFMVFNLLPIILVVVTSVTSADYVSFPPRGFSLRWYQSALSDPGYLDSFRTSLEVGLLSAAIATVAGTLCALGLARHRFPGSTALGSLFLTPLMVPRLVIGLSILMLLDVMLLPAGRNSLILGHAVLTLPFVIRLVGASLAGLDPNLERAARSLGASAWKAFLWVTLPMIKTGVVAGAAMAAIVSFDDIPVAIFLNNPEQTTLPVRIFAALEQGSAPDVLAVSSVTIFIIAAIVVIVERFVGLSQLYQVRPTHSNQEEESS